MANLGSQRYLNDMLMRLANLRRCMASIDTNQLDLSDRDQDLARESLAQEYQSTLRLVREQLALAESGFNPYNKLTGTTV